MLSAFFPKEGLRAENAKPDVKAKLRFRIDGLFHISYSFDRLSS
jgi:hypothetical protein